MEAAEYISSVEEQLKAYDFAEREIESELAHSFFFKENKGRLKTINEAVIIKELEDADVESIKIAINQAEKALGHTTYNKESRGHTELYVLLVPSTTTKAMRIATKRGAAINKEGKNIVFLPVIADLQNERLPHSTPSLPWKFLKIILPRRLLKITALSQMADNVDDYLKI